MKKYLLLACLIVFITTVFSQQPGIKWSKVMGGSQNELEGAFATISLNFGRHAAVDVDKINGNIYVATTSRSSDYYLHNNFGEEDIWLICMNSSGDTLWTKTIGGSSWERVHRVHSLKDGGFIIVGATHSQDEYFDNYISNYYDAFIIRFNESGDIIWQKMYGGNYDDFLFDIIETSDGFLLACGESYSFTGDLADSGSGMNWALKINPQNGDVKWSKTFLGPDGDSPDWLENVYRLTELSDNSIILTGYTTPDFNDFNQDRINIISIDLDGNLNWHKKIGDTGSGDYPAAIMPADDNNFFILGKLAGSVSNGEYDFYGGGGDFWLIKMNSEGDIIWEQNYGGSDLDIPYDFSMNSDGDLYLAGLSRSYDHDAYLEGETAPEGWVPTHFWLLKLNSEGEILYNKKLGGSGNDFASGIAIDNNGDIVIVGGTESDDQAVEHNFGGRDLWILSLSYEADIVWGCTDPLAINYNPDATHDDGSCVYDDNSVSDYLDSEFNVYPNPSAGLFNISTCEVTKITLYSICGKILLENYYNDSDILDISSFTGGVYFLHAKSKSFSIKMRIVNLP